MEIVPITIVGGGVVGSAIAYELSRKGIEDIVVLERNSSLGEEQSGRNSGVIHAGILNLPGTLKSSLCVEGNPLLYEFCRENGVPHANVGKFSIVDSSSDWENVHRQYENGRANGTTVQEVTAAEIRQREPSVRALGGFYTPTTGIVSATDLVSTLERIASSKGTYFSKNTEVMEIEPVGELLQVAVKYADGSIGSFPTKYLVNAGGLCSENIARMLDPLTPYSVDFLKGEYCTFKSSSRKELQFNGTNIYPTFRDFLVPETGENIQCIRAHLTPTLGVDGKISDTVLVGPFFYGVLDSNDYTLQQPHENFFTDIKSFFPGIRLSDLRDGYAGILGFEMNSPDNDYVIEKHQDYPAINLVGMGSPALTSCLAIARYVVSMMDAVK